MISCCNNGRGFGFNDYIVYQEDIVMFCVFVFMFLFVFVIVYIVVVEDLVYIGLFLNIGVGGYDVVSYFDVGQVMKGFFDYIVEYFGVIW